MSKATEIIYAVVGAGDFAVDKVKGVRKVVDRRANQKLYKDFIKRGRTVSTTVKNSTPGKQFVRQAEPARAKVEDALKNVTKTFGVNVVKWPERTNRRTSTTPRKKTTAAKSTTRRTPASRKKTTTK